jgi:hypothetical protein
LDLGVGQFAEFQDNLFSALAVVPIRVGQAVRAVRFAFMAPLSPMEVKFCDIHAV